MLRYPIASCTGRLGFSVFITMIAQVLDLPVEIAIEKAYDEL